MSDPDIFFGTLETCCHYESFSGHLFFWYRIANLCRGVGKGGDTTDILRMHGLEGIVKEGKLAYICLLVDALGQHLKWSGK